MMAQRKIHLICRVAKPISVILLKQWFSLERATMNGQNFTFDEYVSSVFTYVVIFSEFFCKR